MFRCKYTTDPDSSWQLSRWISARDVIANPRNILDVLSPRNEIMPCDQEKCNGRYIFSSERPFILYLGKLHQTKILLNSPEIFTLCVGWDSVHSSPHEIQTFLEALPTEIKLDSCFRALAPQGTILAKTDFSPWSILRNDYVIIPLIYDANERSLKIV